MIVSRRSLLQVGLSGMAWFTIESSCPRWIARSAAALSAGDCLDGDRILVIVQQGGGNDGLNTVIPRNDDAYYDARPAIHVPRASQIILDEHNSLHPVMPRLADWFQKNRAGVVQNVGYPNPNLSHFTSTDYYEFGGSPDKPLPMTGWVARMYDSACGGAQQENALFLARTGSRSLPDAFVGTTNYTAPAINSLGEYQLVTASDRALRLDAIAALNRQPPANPDIEFLQRSENLMEASIEDVQTAGQQPLLVPDGSYPNNSLGRGLQIVSQIIRAGFRTRVFYVTQGGYDTHANQAEAEDPLETGSQPKLLGDLDGALDAFLTEMELSGNLDRVLVMTFSEFGRRVAENGSKGTDHGAANCLFVLGGGVQPGVYGGQPDLQDLIKGNLRHKVDFRSVYSRVIADWLGCDPVSVFDQETYDAVIQPDLTKIPFIAPREVAAARNRAWNGYR